MDTFELLRQVGLSLKETQVYLALLELGTASVYTIATKADLKRPTTYLILDELEKRGLVSQMPQRRKSLYVAESPQKLFLDLQRKEDLMKANLPALLALHNARKDKPQVQLFQGKEGVREVYEKALKTKEVLLFTTIRDVNQTYPELVQELIKKTERKEIHVKEILSKTSEDLTYAKSFPRNNHYEQRFASSSLGFHTDNALFDDTVVFFSYEPLIMAVVIANKDIYLSMHTLFELAWKSAEKYEDVITEKNE